MARTSPHVATIREYFDRLEAGDFEAAAACFTPDAEYYHPPIFQDESRVTGRDAIEGYFEERGYRDVEHEFVKSIETDDAAAVVGTFTGESIEDTLFVSFAEFEGEEMAYYIAAVLE